jgi:hypothetical protein
VFSGARYLNGMDKIASHVIHMYSNFRSLNSRVSDAKVLNSRASDVGVSEVSNMNLGGLEFESLVSKYSLGFETWSRRPEA